MIRYIKCPRCDLNFINPDVQEYCDVCLAELKGTRLKFADIEDDEDDVAEEETVEEQLEVCPVCGIKRMKPGDTMCEVCKTENEEYVQEEEEVDLDEDEEWKTYLDEEEDGEDLTLDDDMMDDDFSDEDDEDEDDEYIGDEDDPLSDYDEDFVDNDTDEEDEDEDEDDEDNDDGEF